MVAYKVKVKVSSLFLNEVVHHVGDCIIAAEEDLDSIRPYVKIMHPVDEVLETLEDIVDPLAKKIKEKRGKAKTDPAEETALGTISVDTPGGSAEVDVVTDIHA